MLRSDPEDRVSKHAHRRQLRKVHSLSQLEFTARVRSALLPLALWIATLAWMIAPVAHAASAPGLSPEDKALVDKATAYIEDLKTVKGGFTQISSTGATSTGTFYMQRPGKARFQYDPPADMLVVSDGSNVSIYDGRLKTFDEYPLGSTPLVLLLARQVRLDRGVTITGVDREPGGFAITARDARKQAEGRITIYFSDDPIALKGWTIVDAQGQETRVRLGELTPVAGLDPSLFVLRDPRRRGGRP